MFDVHHVAVNGKQAKLELWTKTQELLLGTEAPVMTFNNVKLSLILLLLEKTCEFGKVDVYGDVSWKHK